MHSLCESLLLCAVNYLFWKCVAAIEWPLLSEFGRRYERPEGKSYWLQKTSPGPACLDLLGSIRPKIYLLAKKITEAVNTEAQLFDGLGLQNQVFRRP